jgi:hypothetical protein
MRRAVGRPDVTMECPDTWPRRPRCWPRAPGGRPGARDLPWQAWQRTRSICQSGSTAATSARRAWSAQARSARKGCCRLDAVAHQAAAGQSRPRRAGAQETAAAIPRGPDGAGRVAARVRGPGHVHPAQGRASCSPREGGRRLLRNAPPSHRNARKTAGARARCLRGRRCAQAAGRGKSCSRWSVDDRGGRGPRRARRGQRAAFVEAVAPGRAAAARAGAAVAHGGSTAPPLQRLRAAQLP